MSLVFNNCGAGAGCGLECLLLKRLPVDYGRQSELSFFFPDRLEIAATVVVKPGTSSASHTD